jgi:SdpI/YfhL protein family
MKIPIPYVLCLIGVVSILVSIPLVLRKIPMNPYYGIRVRKAFVSESNWYAINEYGGKVFLGFGVCVLLFGIFTVDLAPPPTSPWAPVFMVVPLLGLVPVLALVRSYSRRFPDR